MPNYCVEIFSPILKGHQNHVSPPVLHWPIRNIGICTCLFAVKCLTTGKFLGTLVLYFRNFFWYTVEWKKLSKKSILIPEKSCNLINCWALCSTNNILGAMFSIWCLFCWNGVPPGDRFPSNPDTSILTSEKYALHAGLYPGAILLWFTTLMRTLFKHPNKGTNA